MGLCCFRTHRPWYTSRARGSGSTGLSATAAAQSKVKESRNHSAVGRYRGPARYSGGLGKYRRNISIGSGDFEDNLEASKAGPQRNWVLGGSDATSVVAEPVRGQTEASLE